MENLKYTNRIISRIVIEADSPLAIGSGDKSVITDTLAAKDANGLPYIPATSLAGLLRHSMGYASDTPSIFGHHDSNSGLGSELIFTEARIIGEDGKTVDGLQPDLSSDFYRHFDNLPIRQHVRINDRGTAERGGKFDEQTVFKGTRFCFETELVCDGDKHNREYKRLISMLSSPSFRIGGGTRSGFGRIKVISVLTRHLDFRKEDNLTLYLEKSSDLSDASFWNTVQPQGEIISDQDDNWVEYVLKLKPEDFFLFGSGHGDDDADITPVKEDIIEWNDGKPSFIKDCLLIPASSLKGAMSHRIAFHYNRLNKIYADKIDDKKLYVGCSNEAVKMLFGSEGEFKDGQTVGQKRGNTLFTDIICNPKTADKILNHVSIDRFTGGAMDGALFTEKVSYTKDCSFDTTILVSKKVLKNELVEQAFESALNDLCKGMLPLGGGSGRGNGIFTGKYKKNEL